MMIVTIMMIMIIIIMMIIITIIWNNILVDVVDFDGFPMGFDGF